MKKIAFILFTAVCSLHSIAQYKNDNILYQTVFAEDLCKTLEANPGYLLLDVRSKGEHHDTSSSSSLNIGRMKGALNIDIREIPLRINEINGYKNKPVFVYCSHSQRSRRVSKILADSGFTKVYNINGGMTTLHLSHADKIFCKDLYATNLGYRIITPQKLCDALNSGSATVIDIRKDSAFNSLTTDAKVNARGKIKTAIHIPVTDLIEKTDMNLSNKPVILIDETGDQSAKAANMLVGKGFKDVSILLNGLDQWNNTNSSELPCRSTYWQRTARFNMITSDDFDKLAREHTNLTLIDIRTPEEFNNSHKESYRNGGRIKNAVNIPASSIAGDSSVLEKNKNAPVVIYGFSSNPEVFAAAATLATKGFTNVNVLLGGLFNLRWRAANIKGKSQLKDWVVDVPEMNL